MSEKKEKVPKLRFPGFTDAWEQRELGDLIFKMFGGASITPDDYRDCGVATVPKGAVNSSGIADLSGSKYVDEAFYNKNSNASVYQNELVTSLRDLVPTAPNMGRIVKLKGPNEKYLMPQGVYRLIINSDVDENFLISFSNTDKFRKVIFQEKNGSTQVHIRNSEYLGIPIARPSKEEQQQIGSFFKQLDNLITLHQRKLNNMKNMKAGLLQKMFPKDGEDFPEVRFPGFTDAWEQRKLKEISDKVIEKNKDNLFSETLTNSAEFGIINQRDFFDKDISNEKNLDGYYVVHEDDFVYNPRISNLAPVGPIKRNKLGRTGVMSPLYYVFRTRDIDKSYLEYFFDSTGWHNFMKLNGDSGARSDRFAIKDSVFIEMPIPYPCLDEQIKIGEFFKILDHLITLHQRKLEHLQEQKKALLQQMFV